MTKLQGGERGGTIAGNAADWDDFRVFLEVVRHGSFNRAAVKLNMTQPTVSRRLMRLEKAIGARLFERDRRGPRLTQEGRRIYADVNAAQAALDRATKRMNRPAERAGGECKLFMGDSIASYWVTRYLAPFFDRYPGIELKLFGSYDPAMDKSETFDLHTHYYHPAEPGELSIRLGTLHYLPFGSREYFCKHDMPRNMEDIKSHRLLDLSDYLTDIDTWTNRSREEVSHGTALFTNLGTCLAEAVHRGAGIALLPTYLAATSDAFVPLEIDMHFPVPLNISYRPDAVKKWPVRKTLDYLREHVFDRKNMPWFADNYIPPSADWAEYYANAIKQAAGAAGTGSSRFAENGQNKP